MFGHIPTSSLVLTITALIVFVINVVASYCSYSRSLNREVSTVPESTFRIPTTYYVLSLFGIGYGVWGMVVDHSLMAIGVSGLAYLFMLWAKNSAIVVTRETVQCKWGNRIDDEILLSSITNIKLDAAYFSVTLTLTTGAKRSISLAYGDSATMIALIRHHVDGGVGVTSK